MSPQTYVEPQPRSGLTTALVAGAIIALVAANIYLYVQIDHLRTDLATTKEALSTGLSNLKDASSVTVAAQQRHIDTLKADLEATHRAAASMSSEAKAQAEAHAEQLARQIEAEQTKMQASLNSEIADAKQTSAAGITAANSKIADVATDVGTVRTQASQTQDQLNKTISDLKSVTGDLGLQSGLIATNGKELQALILKGERNYYQFNLVRGGKDKDKDASRKPQRVGDIAIKIVSLDSKRNKYTITVLADDKTVEKKDKSINEPVQFLTAKGGRTPYELVVNTVNKDSLVGYLATPKDLGTR